MENLVEVQWIKVNNLSAYFSIRKEEWLTLLFIQKSQLSEMSLHVSKGWFSPFLCLVMICS